MNKIAYLEFLYIGASSRTTACLFIDGEEKIYNAIKTDDFVLMLSREYSDYTFKVNTVEGTGASFYRIMKENGMNVDEMKVKYIPNKMSLDVIKNAVNEEQ